LANARALGGALASSFKQSAGLPARARHGAATGNEKVEQARRAFMRQAMQLIKKIQKDEEGAALVEYTVLLGVMLVAVISTIVLVGGWVNTKWVTLWTTLQTN
jgi:pilus assembly protein Flp/PilA